MIKKKKDCPVRIPESFPKKNMKRKRQDEEGDDPSTKEETKKRSQLGDVVGHELKNLYVPQNYCICDGQFGIAFQDVEQWTRRASPDSQNNLWLVDNNQEWIRIALHLSDAQPSDRSIYPIGCHHLQHHASFRWAKNGITWSDEKSTIVDYLEDDELSLAYQRNLKLVVFSVLLSQGWKGLDEDVRTRRVVLKIWNRYLVEHPFLLKVLDPLLPPVLENIVGEYFSVDTKLCWLPSMTDTTWPSVLPRHRFDHVFQDYDHDRGTHFN